MLRITKAVLLPLGFLMLGEVALADSNDPNEMALENRQAVMELIGQNFGPIQMLIPQFPLLQHV